MKVNIVLYNSSDKQTFKQLVLDGLKEFGFSYSPQLDSDLNNPDTYAESGGILYLAKLEGKVIGSIAVKKKGEGAELKRWYVSKDHQGEGIGSMLMDKAIQFCKDQGFKVIEFETNKKFTRAHELYQKRGFKVFKEDRESLYMSKEI